MECSPYRKDLTLIIIRPILVSFHSEKKILKRIMKGTMQISYTCLEAIRLAHLCGALI